MTPLKSGTDRYDKWSKRFAAESQSCSPIMNRLMQGVSMPARVLACFEDLVAMEAQVRAVIDAQGVSILLAGQYLNAGRQFWKIKNRYNGETASMEAAAQIGKWVARGLALSVLESIRTDVFGITAPAGP